MLMLTLGVIPSSAQSSSTYVVQPGDSLLTIATTYCTTWSEIYNTNSDLIGHNPNLLYIGIPLSITNRCGTGGAIGGQIVDPSTTGVFDRGVRTYATGKVVDMDRYIVAWGDTVFSIALRFGLTADQLWDANEGVSNLGLYAGTRILIPGLNGTSPTGSSNTSQATTASQAGTPLTNCTLTSNIGRFEAYNSPGDGEVATLIEVSVIAGENKHTVGGLTWYRTTYLDTHLWVADTDSISISGNC